jgi:Rieske Fe-S protein
LSQHRDPQETNKNAVPRINPERRTFIKTIALTGVAAVVIGVPLASYVIAPSLEKGTGRWFDFGPVEDLDPDAVEMLSYEFMVKDGWLVLPQRGFVWAKTEDGGKLRVFSSTCTHLACNVIWREEEEVFVCPCHSGQFDANGKNIAGPPTKPLAVLEHKIEDGNLKIFLTV